MTGAKPSLVIHDEVQTYLESIDAIIVEYRGKFWICVNGHSIAQMTAAELADPESKARLMMSAEFLANGGE